MDEAFRNGNDEQTFIKWDDHEEEGGKKKQRKKHVHEQHKKKLRNFMTGRNVIAWG